MTKPVYLNDAHWHSFIQRLVAAAHDPADPASEVAMILSPYVCPESAREDVERFAHGPITAA